MYKRPHHQRIHTVLESMNADFLRDAKCFFGGGTAIALLLGEYRESVDIDFLCADQEGYRKLRESVFDHGLQELFTKEIETIREVRADRDGIRTFLAVDGTPVKFEIVREGRITLEGRDVRDIPVPCLTREDLFAEKLLANTDRYGDKSAMSRDVIDLLVMESQWGKIPDKAWDKASGAYGDSVYVALKKAKEALRDDPQYFTECVEKMGVDTATYDRLNRVLNPEKSKASGLDR